MSLSKEEITQMFLDVFPNAEYNETRAESFPVQKYKSHGVILQLFDYGIIDWNISIVDHYGGFERLVGSNSNIGTNTIKTFMEARKEPHPQQLPFDCVLSLLDENNYLPEISDQYGVSRQTFLHESTDKINMTVFDYSEWNGGGWYAPNTKWKLSLRGVESSEIILSNLFDGTFEDLKNKVDETLLRIKMEML